MILLCAGDVTRQDRNTIKTTNQTRYTERTLATHQGPFVTSGTSTIITLSWPFMMHGVIVDNGRPRPADTPTPAGHVMVDICAQSVQRQAEPQADREILHTH
jgi:hypothetical protein